MSTASADFAVGFPEAAEADPPGRPLAVSSSRSEVQVRPRSERYLRVKHAADFVAAALLLFPALPVMLLAAAVTRLTSAGPAFYWQTRLGRHGRPYRICKIRTMVQDAEVRTGAVWSRGDDDPRVTPFGRFLRRTHIDEFPQLFQVLAGHMSLIGPRPERPEFVQRLQWEIPRYIDRLAVRPGVTGLAQLVLPPDSDVEDVRRKVQHDLYYIRHMGPWLDLLILAHTVRLLLKSVLAAAPLRLPRGEKVYNSMADLTDA